jgi:hypothetical protein
LKSARLRILLLASVLVVLAAALSACGRESEIHEANATSSTGSTYVTLGPLDYSVQLSRQLNARDVEDRTYLEGLAADQARLANDEEWFAVFIKVDNPSKGTQTTASQFEIVDTTGATYKPVALPASNPYAYQATRVVPDGSVPAASSLAAQGPTAGQMLLFKIKLETLQSRPLVLKIHGPQAPFPVASVTLDV